MTTAGQAGREGQITWMNAINRLTSRGYRITLDGEKLRYAYHGNGNPIQDELTPLLAILKAHKGKVLDYLRLQLLQTPLSEIEKPILIESGYLKGRFYLVANEEQAREIEQAGGLCYLPEEIRTLLGNSRGMEEGALRHYLTKVHMVKKTFPGARVQAQPRLNPNPHT